MTNSDLASGSQASASSLEACCAFERFMDIAAGEAHILQVAIIEHVQCEERGFALAADDGSGNPIVHEARQSCEQEVCAPP
jgi:hypothetical protein